MKRLIISLFAIGSFLFSNGQASLFQRVAFAAVEMEIPANALSKTVESFCFDGLRASPSSLASYGSVLLDDASEVILGNAAAISLTEAFNRGYVKMVGNDYASFRFQNMTDLPMRLVTKKSTIVGQSKSDLDGLIKEAIDLIEKNDQEELWIFRKNYEKSEKKITVLKMEKILKAEHPTQAQIAQAESLFKAKYKINSQSKFQEKIDAIYENALVESEFREIESEVLVHEKYLQWMNETEDALRIAEAKFKGEHNIKNKQELKDAVYDIVEEMREEEEFIPLNIQVLQFEGLLKSEKPSDIAEATSILKERLHAVSNADYRAKIEGIEWQIMRYSSLTDERSLVFAYEGLSEANAKNPDILKAAENAYKSRFKLTTLEELNNSIEKKAKIIEAKRTILYSEGETNLQDLRNLKEAEHRFLNKYNISVENKDEEFVNLYNEYQRDLTKASDLLYALRKSEESTESITKMVEAELSLEQTGKLTNKKLVKTLSFYKENLYPFLISNFHETGGIIEIIKLTKKQLGLPESLSIDATTEKFITDFRAALKGNKLDLIHLREAKVDGEKIHLTISPDYTTVFKLVSLNRTDMSIEELGTFNQTFYAGCYVNKISPLFFCVDDKIVHVKDLNQSIQNSYVLQQKKFVEFGSRITTEDAESIIRNSQVKNMVASGDDVGKTLVIKSNQYDFSEVPLIQKDGWNTTTNLYFDLKKSSNGKGVVARKITFKIFEVANSVVDRVITGIKSLFSRAKISKDIDFASELKKDLKLHGVDIKNLTATWDGIDVTIQFNTAKSACYCVN
jgi:hypothetical protein